MTRISKVCCTIFMASTALSGAHAQDSVEPQGDIIVTGTRAVGTQVAESAAPIQLLTDDAISRVGQPNLNQALTQIVPSFQAQTQGTDMANYSLSAKLRGVSPNHTLLLVNGKRRHSNAILQVINGAFGGSAAPSLDLIPPDAVQRVEIFQEGAAAIYGSDAIAGVINLILKSNDSGVTAKGSVGQYYDGEGLQYSASANIGLPVGDSGFFNVTLFHRRNDVTVLGDGQTSVRNIDGSTVQFSGATNPNTLFNPIYTELNARDGTANINGGQPESQLNILFYNLGYDAGDVELYSFGDVSYRDGSANQGYRPPNRVCVGGTRSSTNPTGTLTDPASCFEPTRGVGMVPLIEVNQNEFSLTAGARGEIAGGWNWDLSTTYAEDEALVYTTRSANASLYVATFGDARDSAGNPTGFTPRDFYDGGFKFTQYVAQLDVTKEFDVGMSDPLTFAFGSEYRRESYEIYAGDSGSRFVEGGQSFPGYALSDAGSTKRNSKAVYANVIVKPVTDWVVDIAGRFEDYSDFGSTTIGKITTRYDFSPAFALRATASTGFRAPSLQESGYSATNVGPTQATIQLAPGSPGAVAAGFSALQPEESTNVSLGAVFRPAPRLVVTLDGYYIKIRDRIVSSGGITGQRSGTPVTNEFVNGIAKNVLVDAAIAASGKEIDPTVLQNGTLSIQTYTNGIDTETWGAEFSARYPIELSAGTLDLSLGVNYNDTSVTKNALGDLFNAQARAVIETSAPKWKGVFGALFTSGPFSANARATYYSEATILTSSALSSCPVTSGRCVAAPIAGGFFEAVVDGTFIFDLELGYDFTDSVNVAIGANNLFNKIPETTALIPPELVTGGTYPTNGTSPYISGTTTINAPYNHGPYGTNGGYYYARLTFKF